MYVISTENLTKTYGDYNSVNGINLKIPEGEIYGFLGPNGAGKTTTLKMLLGLIKPTKGEINIFGEKLDKNRASILKRTGSLIESPSYYSHLTGYENLKIIQQLRGVPSKNIDEVLKIVRLENQKNKRVSDYSLGMKQRLGVAMSLISFPKLLLLDEPTNGLDPAGIGEIRALIKSLPKKYGMTILISSHLLSEIEQIATSVGIISEGELLYQGSMNELSQKNKRKILLRTEDNLNANELLNTKGYVCSIVDEYIDLKNQTDYEIAKVNKLLINNGIDLYRIEEKKIKLEDIFLDLTGRERSL